jgi:large subunit ribosomal protein L7Ae
MPKAYVKFSVPKELSNKVLQALEAAKNSGKLRRGINETTKAIEKSQAQLVIIAEDIEPEEIAMHLPVLCEEKKIPYIYVPSKLELGRASGIDVQSAAIAVVDAGEAKDSVGDIVKSIGQLKK